jgi:hypothetical protein
VPSDRSHPPQIASIYAELTTVCNGPGFILASDHWHGPVIDSGLVNIDAAEEMHRDGSPSRLRSFQKAAGWIADASCSQWVRPSEANCHGFINW